MMLKLNAMHGMRKMEEWKEYKLSELLEIPIRNGLTKPKAIRGQGVKMIGMKEIFAYDIIRNCDMELVPITDKELASSSIIEEDLLFARQSLTLEGAGKCSIVGSVNNDTVFESHLIRVRVNKKLANPYFIYYYFNSRYGKEQIKGLVQQVAAAGIRGKELINLMIKCPSLPTQQKIANILSSLDDKIEVNRRINEQLEELAQALFKSWFVDFEPFKDGEFVESELGMIPKGWKVGKAEEFYKITIGKTPPRKEQEWFTKSSEDVKWVSISDMGNCGTYVADSSEYLTNDAIQRFNIGVVSANTILLSFKLTIGRVAIAMCDLTTNEAIARFSLINETLREYTYLMLKQYNYANLGSTSSIATAVNSKIIKQMRILMPKNEVIFEFSKLMKPVFENIKKNQQEITHLTNLRDTLLPKLMSGEIDVNEVEI